MVGKSNLTRPNILSLHPTMQCDYGCTNCYLKKDIDSNLKEKSPMFFMELLRYVKSSGIQEISIPINYVNYNKNSSSTSLDNFDEKDWDNCDKNLHYFKWIAGFCSRESLRFTATSNYDFFEQYEDLDVGPLDLVSISVNDFVTGNEDRISKAINVMKALKSKVRIVNCNILLSERMVSLLKHGLAKKILETADSLYLLASKPIQISIAKYYEWCTELNEAGVMVDSQRIILDSCIKYSAGLTGGLCDRHKMIYVSPYGEIKMCSFDKKNMAEITNPSDFKDIFEKYFPMTKQDSCTLMSMEQR